MIEHDFAFFIKRLLTRGISIFCEVLSKWNYAKKNSTRI